MDIFNQMQKTDGKKRQNEYRQDEIKQLRLALSKMESKVFSLQEKLKQQKVEFLNQLEQLEVARQDDLWEFSKLKSKIKNSHYPHSRNEQLDTLNLEIVDEPNSRNNRNSIKEWTQSNKEIEKPYSNNKVLKTSTIDNPKSLIGKTISHLRFNSHYADIKPRLDFSERSYGSLSNRNLQDPPAALPAGKSLDLLKSAASQQLVQGLNRNNSTQLVTLEKADSLPNLTSRASSKQQNGSM